MDSITEFLSNVFVDSKHRRRIEREISEQIQEVPRKKLSITKENVHKESQSAEIQDSKEVNSNKSSNKNSEKENVSNSSNTSSNTNSNKNSKKDHVSSDTSSDTSEEHSSEKSEYTSSSSSSVEPKIQKIILKAQEFYKRPIILMNDKYESHFDILSDILHKLSNFKNVESIYDNTLNVITYNENKPYFKDLLLENPYLYFNNISIKTKLSKIDLKNFIEESEKRRLLIIDLECFSDSSIISKFLDDSIHVIVLVSNYNDVIPVYNILGDSTLLINKKDKHKMIQRKLFQKVLKQINKNLSENEFVDILNDDNIDIQRLVIKNKELRYI